MSLPFFPLYPKDFLGDTGQLNAAKFGGYARLVFSSWLEPLCDDIEELSEISRLQPDNTRKILERYFYLEDGFWKNKRLESERVKANELHNKRVESGKKGAEARYGHSRSNSGANGSATSEDINSAIASQNPELTTQSIELRTENQELNEIVSFFPESFFHDMTIPNILLQVQEDHGSEALRAMCEAVATIGNPDKRTGGYVRGIVKRLDLAGIASGRVSKQGETLEWFNRAECVTLAEKSGSGKMTDELFRVLKDGEGNIMIFPEDQKHKGETIWVKK
jgi:uncharacterized protein YdaU (DUF1376 family)